MDSVRSFVALWVSSTAAILGYAWFDLRHNPWLYEERNFTMCPDLSRVPDLMHWGGRLLKEQATSLLVMNAIVIGGLLALAAAWIGARIARAKSEHAAEAVDVTERPSLS